MDFICFLFFFGFDGEDIWATIPIPGPVKGSSFMPEQGDSQEIFPLRPALRDCQVLNSRCGLLLSPLNPDN